MRGRVGAVGSCQTCSVSLGQVGCPSLPLQRLAAAVYTSWRSERGLAERELGHTKRTKLQLGSRQQK